MADQKFTASSIRQNRHGESRDEVIKLEAELRKAYTLKILSNQIAEKDANRFFEKVRAKFEEKMMISKIQKEIEELEKKKEGKFEKCEEYKKELEQQMQSLKEERKKVLEKERKERKVMKEVDRIRDEEEESKKLKKKIALSERINRDYQMQEEIKEILKIKEEEFNKKNLEENREFLKVLEQRNLEVRKLREEQMRKREKAVNLVSGMIIDFEAKRHERKNLITDLVVEELQCQEMIQEREKYLRRRREKEELTTFLNEQIVFNEECKRRFALKDRDFAEAVLKRILEDERLERSTLEARRRKMFKYRDELEQLMEEKKAMREKHIAQIREDLKAEQLQEQVIRDRLIDEKIDLLKLHSGNVAEFINRNRLNKEENKILADCLMGKN